MQVELDAMVVLVTVPTSEEAEIIAKLLLEHRKAACVNIVPRVDSLFWWEGKIDSSREVLLIVKTRAALMKEVIDLVKQAHSYTTPEVIALPIVAGSQDYLKWLAEETGTAGTA